jgi:glucose-6-phosphate isomerase
MIQYSLDFPKKQINISAEFLNTVDELPLFKYLESSFSSEQYQEAVQKFKNFTHIIHLGTGGSSLGPQALYAITDTPTKNFIFFDNIDPDGLVKRLKYLDFSKTGLLIASKSGNTAETLVQLATLKKIYEDKGHNLKDHLVVITQSDGNALHTFAQNHNILVIPHHPQIGGRFAVFAEVGAFPGLLMGLDMATFRKGAQNVIKAFKEAPTTHPAIESACFLANSKLHPVMFPYADKLKIFGAWFVQLWAESLGKKNKVGERFGSTPIQALGATDQHSQLQLYLDGPKDKFFTFLNVNDKANIEVSDLGIDHPAYTSLRGCDLKDLLQAELRATYETIRTHELPLRLIVLPTVTPYYLGQLMINTVLETLAVASIWNVNPFDQPAVEEGKVLALKFLNDKKA